MPLLFALALFTSASLVFWLEPMIGKLLLPALGGAPAVWATCLAFFQVLLLAGYLVAHLVATQLGPRAQVVAYLALVAAGLASLPISLAHVPPPTGDANPVPWLIGALGVSVGVPFLALATASPLLQRWFARASGGRDPYWLAIASNAGSLAGLVAFPVALEPRFALGAQASAWAVTYGALLVIVAACAFAAWRAPGEASAVREAAIVPWPRRLRWFAWSAVPSMLLVSVTNWVSTDVSAVPLLWAVPLALYLVTFMLAFARPAGSDVRIWSRLAMVFVPLLLFLASVGRREPGWAVAALHFTAFFVAARALHGALASDRPAVGGLTGFYLWTSVGGAAGGIFASLAAPLLFGVVAEYPLALVAALLMLPPEGASLEPRELRRPAIVGAALVLAWWFTRATAAPAWIAAIVCYLAPFVLAAIWFRRPPRFAAGAGPVLLATLIVGFEEYRVVERSFFGVLRVEEAEVEGGRFRWLKHGLTYHGLQRVSANEAERLEPYLYYARRGPMGDVMALLATRGTPIRAGVVGLGVGALASYARPGDRFTFFEIDPVVLRLARDSGEFTFLSEARGTIDYVLGDARQSLERTDSSFDLLVVDAFSSDSVPVHLLTREAFRDAYLPRLAPGGLVLLHLSNRFLALPSVGAAIAREAGLSWRLRDDGGTEDPRLCASIWMAIARTPEALDGLPGEEWTDRLERVADRPWTDDFSDVWSALDW